MASSASEPAAPDLLGRLGDAAAKADERLRDATERVPGKSLAVVGYATLLLAVVLELVPGSHGGRYVSFGWDATKLGHVWDVVFLVLAGAALAGRVHPKARRLSHPALHTAVALLALAQAYLLLDPSLVPLLVLAAAVLLTYDAVHTGLARQARDTAQARLDAIPNATTTGLAVCLAALALTKLPGDPMSSVGGVVVLGSSVTSLLWTLVLLAAGAAAIAVDRQALKTPYDAWIVDGAVLLFAAWAFVLFNLSLVPLLWLGGATIAAYDRLRGTDLRALLTGPRRLVLLGVPLCLVALSFTWSKHTTTGTLMGGADTSYSSYYGGYVTTYNYAKYYLPGFTFSGTGLNQGPSAFSLSPLIVAGLLALLLAVTWRRWEVPVAIVGVTALWTVFHLGGGLGPWLFLPGLAVLALAAVTARRQVALD